MSRPKKDPQAAARLAEERARQGAEAFKPEAKAPAVDVSSDEILAPIHRDNEIGDARIVAKVLRGVYAFDKQRGMMFAFNGAGFWQKDVLDAAKAEANAILVRLYLEESGRQNTRAADPSLSDEDRKRASALRDKLNKRVQAVNTHRRMDNIMRLAAIGKDSLAITGDEWNSNPWELAAGDRIVDLRTGLDRKGRPQDYINKAAPTEWKGLHAEAPTWEAFLASTLESKELATYLQRVFGSAIVGVAQQQEFYVLWGEGRNGKGTLIETVKRILGDLAGPIASELIMGYGATTSASGANPEILDLQGRRIVWASETKEGQKLNLERVKRFTGADTLKARYNYSNDMIEFVPSHTLFLLTNHKPRVGAGEYALWQRLRLIPFRFSFVDEPKAPHERPKDPELPARLLEEGPGILAWLVRGCLAWQKEGLTPPAEVLDATREYEQAEDVIQQFIDACCVIGKNRRQRAGPFVEAFAEWFKEENGAQAKPFGARTFREHMEKKGFKVDATGRHNFYAGIALKTESASGI
jgi:putative DNA primase/helicase